jgi:hypothetical protein
MCRAQACCSMKIAAHNHTSHRDIVIKVLLALMVLGGLSGMFALVPSAQKPLAQIFGAAVLFVALWRVSLFGVRIPRAIFVVATAAVIGGALIRFSYANLSRGAVLVATVSSSDLQQDKRIYRDRLRRFLGSSHNSLVGIHHGRVENSHDVRNVLEEFSSVGAVLWGTPRWMTLSFRPVQSLSLLDVSKTSTGGRLVADGVLPNLTIIRSLPDISLGQGHQDGSVFFIAKLILAWSQFSADSVQPDQEADFDRRLEVLSRVPVRNNSRVHLAAPMWIRGTYHLIEAIKSPEYSKDDLTESIVSFKYALSELQRGGNPALQAAVRNNYAVALLVEFSRDKKRTNLKKVAAKQLVAASRLGALGGLGGAIAADNYALLQTAGVFSRR